jgi:hypothetical protein
MKKITFLSLVLFSALLFVACGGNKNNQVNDNSPIHNLRGLVKHVHLNSDSIPLLTLGIENGDSLLFTLADAKIQNSMMLPGDSVIVDYIGGDDALRALVVTVLPKPIQPVEKPDTLVTAPAKEKKEVKVDPKKLNAPTGAKKNHPVPGEH